MSAADRHDNSGREMTGLVIILIGVGLLLNTMDILPFASIISRYWLSLLFVAIGVLHLSKARGSEGWAGGAFWIVLGAAFFVARLNYWLNPWRLLGPALIIWIGMTILLKSSGRSSHREIKPIENTGSPNEKTASVDSRDSISATAILGGFDRRCISQNFKGGDLTTILGGGKVDLRYASIGSDQAVLEVFTLMGGIEIFVPQDWIVESRVTPVLGGYGDTTMSPKESTKRLTVQGTTIMGGITVKN